MSIIADVPQPVAATLETLLEGTLFSAAEIARLRAQPEREVVDALNLLVGVGLAHQAGNLYTATLAARAAAELLGA
jgi:hypothetical protein